MPTSFLKNFPSLPIIFISFFITVISTGCGGGGGGSDGSGSTVTQDTFTVGGTVTGLTGSGLVLTDEKNNVFRTINNNGIFTFSLPLVDQSAYDVTIQTQPTSPNQTCSIANSTGSINGSNVTDIQITCTNEKYKITGEVVGLVGSNLVLQNNGGDNLLVSGNGSFVFNELLEDGSAYNVTIQSQPNIPQQTCGVGNSSGNVNGGNVVTKITCVTNGYAVGGVVTGLNGAGLVLQNNTGDNLNINADGSFSFATPLVNGSSYEVTVLNQPTGLNQTCTISNASGSLAGGSVSTIGINCTTNAYNMGVNVAGLQGAGLVLQNNLGDNLAVAANGSYNFSQASLDGSAYKVTVLTEPTNLNQTCTIANPEGLLAGGNVALQVSCVTKQYSVSVNVAGLISSGLVLLNNNADNLTINVNGAGTFPTLLNDGNNFDITVLTQPSNPSQTCVVNSPTGTLAGTNIVVEVNCAGFSVGGTVSGLRGSGLVLQNNQGDNLNINADGSFTFNSFLPDKSAFNVSVLNQPTSPAQTCYVRNGRNTLSGVSYTTAEVFCTRWEKLNPKTQTVNTLVDITSNGAIRVAVSRLGEIITSTDGATWVLQKPVTTSRLTRVIWSSGDKQFIAIGDKGTIITSNDGVTWQKQSAGSSTAALRAISWRAGKNASDTQYAVVGYEYDTVITSSFILTSTDGKNWSKQLQFAAGGVVLTGISSNNQRFVAVGGDSSSGSYKAIAYTSNNGAAWTQQSTGLSSSNFLNELTWSSRDNQFVALGSNQAGQGTTSISTDGITWVDTPQNLANRFTMPYSSGIKFLNGLYITSTFNGVFTSVDAINWVRQQSLDAFAIEFNGVDWDGSQYIAVGDKGFILTSLDGANWIPQNTLTMNTINKVVADKDRNEYLLSTGNSLFTSTDAVDWLKTEVDFSDASIFDIVSGGSSSFEYMAVGTKGQIRERLLGNWYQRTSPVTTNYFYSVTYNKNSLAPEFVAVGEFGTVFLLKRRSISGGSSFIWQSENSGVSSRLNSVIWSGNQYVAVGGAAIVTSPNGVTWTSQAIPTTAALNDVVMGDGLLVAVGEGDDRFGKKGGILTSPDGKTWAIAANTSQYNLTAIAWNGVNGTGSEYIAVSRSSDTYVLRSTDGITWTKEDLPDTTLWLSDVTWNSVQKKFILVGSAGLIYLSQ